MPKLTGLRSHGAGVKSRFFTLTVPAEWSPSLQHCPQDRGRFPEITNPTLIGLNAPAASHLQIQIPALRPVIEGPHIWPLPSLPEEFQSPPHPTPTHTLHLIVHKADHLCGVIRIHSHAVLDTSCFPGTVPWPPPTAAFQPSFPGLQGLQAHLTSSLPNFKATSPHSIQQITAWGTAQDRTEACVKHQSVSRF